MKIALWACLGLSLSALLSVAGCTSAPLGSPDSVGITFQHRTPIALDVARIEIVDRYVPPLRAPHVEHLHDVSPSEVAIRWTRERLTTVGANGLMTLIIEDASVVEESIRVTDGFGGFFRDEPDTRLVGRIKARFDHVNVGPPITSHSVDVTAEASIEVLESATLNERDLAYLKLVERLAAEFDQALTKEIETTLAPLIRR